ncbi:MAG TPA: hypothetical protein VFD92_26890 [Candidatus Binatia bacterium]|nr:hypothetical protein [Candidatus Binatia bacterium]
MTATIVRLFHSTTEASAQRILSSGFVDGEGTYGMDLAEPLRGVWFSDVPLDGNDFGRLGCTTILAVDVPTEVVAAWEIVEEGAPKRYREWCIPAELVNARGRVQRIGGKS